MDNGKRTPWIKYQEDEWQEWLREAEATILRAIHGIGVFIWKYIPALSRRVAAWLRESCEYAYVLAVRVGRVAALFLAWAAVVFGPLVLYFGWVTGAWALLTLVGSVWGLDRQVRRGQSVWSMWKEDVHA